MRKIRSFTDADDVFSSDFLTRTLIIQSSSKHTSIANLPTAMVLAIGDDKWQIHDIYSLNVGTNDKLLPEGPYFLIEREIHQAWKLYSDTLDAFQTTCIPVDSRGKRRANQ